ncbi:MAG: hypothetical protein MRY59_01335 [Aquisalinus sp.]|nr:hypothetical protein [Aquisalinus sp.]
MADPSAVAAGNADIISWFALALSAISFFVSVMFSTTRQDLQKQDLLLRYDENVANWGAEAISEIAKLETILSIPRPDDFETIYKASLLRISALVDQGRMFIPNEDTGDGHGLEKHPVYQGHRQKVLDILVDIYDWGMAHEGQMNNGDYTGAKHLFALRRLFVAEIVDLLDTKSRRQTFNTIVKDMKN